MRRSSDDTRTGSQAGKIPGNPDIKTMSITPLSKENLRATKIQRKDFDEIPRNPIYLVLDSLKCAHNIGTILRLADAVLATKVYICGNTIVPPNQKIKSASRGAEKWVPWEYRENVIEVVRALKDSGINIVSLEVASSSVPYTEVSYQLPVCIVMGREYDGVSPEVLDLSDHIVHLPIFGMANSLNVSTAASVMMYEILKLIEPASADQNSKLAAAG
ncbi:MAG: RNA methyltransferase [Acidobacteria bacterium]|nr:RNA methyltransferase [Acidobacteriota bacterium]